MQARQPCEIFLCETHPNADFKLVPVHVPPILYQQPRGRYVISYDISTHALEAAPPAGYGQNRG